MKRREERHRHEINTVSSADASPDASLDSEAESSAVDETTASLPLMLVAGSNAKGEEAATDARAADKEARKAARKADEEARRAARKADEEARKAARTADEMKRHEERHANEIHTVSSADDAELVMLPSVEQRLVAFLLSCVAGAGVVAVVAHAAVQLRWCRNRAQVALLDDAAQV